MQLAPAGLVTLQRTVLRQIWFGAAETLGLTWARENVEGAGVALGLLGFHLELYLREAPPPELATAMELLGLVPGVTVRFVRTGRFRFLQGASIGSEIALKNKPGGKIGLFLRGATKTFALTCAHVLDPGTDLPGSPDVVDAAGSKLGSLFVLQRLSTDGLRNPQSAHPIPPNKVDCALVKMDGPVANLLPDGMGAVPKTIADPPENALVRHAIPGGSTGVIRARQADLKIPGDLSDFLFQGLTLMSPLPGAALPVEGDSGSLVTDLTTHRPVGILIARSESFETIDNPHGHIDHVAAICDLGPILDALAPADGPLHIL